MMNASSSLHIGSRVLSPPSTSSSSVRDTAAFSSLPRHGGWRARGRAQRLPLPARAPSLLLQQQERSGRGALVAGAAGAGSGSGSGSGSQAYRFKYIYDPAGPDAAALDPRQRRARQRDALAAPLGERDRAAAGSGSGGPGAGGDAGALATSWGDAPVDPQQLWGADGGGAGSVALPNPHAQRFRIRQAPLPVPVSFPGSDYWEVEALRDYSRDWPRLARAPGGGWALRRGFLAPLADPKLVPFFFYKGLEQVRYSVSDRAFQLLFAALYSAAHAALFALLWASDPLLSAAAALNWARGSLSPAKWALLLALAFTGRVWIYWLVQAGRLVDMTLARVAPPVRRFFW